MTRSRELAELASAYDSGNSLSFRNRIINGDMRIDQRNNGGSVSIGTAVPFIVDRWNAYTDLLNMTGQRSTTAPSNFTNSLSITVGTGASPTAGQISRLEQRIEGFNFADLRWGTASAQTITISFWVRSSVTGTHSGALGNSAGNRAYPFTFPISAANTWEYKTVTIAGDTTGAWLTDNGTGVRVLFNLGTGSTFLGAAGSWAASNFFGATGSVQLSATTGATFYITGVQLEVGTVATSFDFRDYGRELMMCQRYYQINGGNTSGAATTSRMEGFYAFPCEMRASPSIAIINSSAGVWQINGALQTASGVTSWTISNRGVGLQVTVAGTPFTTGSGGSIGSGLLGFNAEL